jgi:hypothetical protein
MTIKSEALKKKFIQLGKGITVLAKGVEMTCTSLEVDGYSISCLFSHKTADGGLTRTLRLLYPIDPYTVTEDNVFDRLAGTVLIAFGVVPLDHMSTKSRIADYMCAGQQEELFT